MGIVVSATQPNIERGGKPMGRYAKEPSGNYENAPPGTHLGICYRLIDLGTQHNEYQGEERTSNQVLISWELPEELMSDGRPFSVSCFLTNSLHEKAALRKHLESWRGRAFTDKELAGFDLETILGKPAYVSVVLNAKGNAKVGAVLAVPKGVTAPKPINPTVAFWIEEWDQAVWDALPKGIQAIIMKSEEYRDRVDGGSPPDDGVEPPPDDNSDIPF
jgi:hypothetical protein